MRAVLLILVALTSACDLDLVEVWELDHDRVIAVRATPPGILAGQTSEIDALLGNSDSSPVVTAPVTAVIVSPPSLAGMLALEDGRWIVTAPDDAAIAIARAELRLEPAAPVPVVIDVGWPAYTATKTLVLGEERANPTIAEMTVDGTSALAASEIVVDRTAKTTLSVPATEEDRVAWLSSCGTLVDFDLKTAFMTVEPDDPIAGSLAVVLRTRDGGVAWKTWSIRAE